MVFIQQMINGLQVGSIYAVIALGYTMVYGIVKLINFAHGEVMMMGAYFAFLAATAGMPVWAVFLISMLGSAVLGMAIERVAYKPLRDAPRISALITAIAMSLFLQNLALVIFKADPKVMPRIVPNTPIHIGDLRISSITVITFLVSVAFMALLTFFVNKTKPGKAMRAVSEDKEAATLMGINANTTISMTFAIGSALAALGGILYGVAYTQVAPTMGLLPGLKAFVAAVLGGIGIIPGAMLGGFIMGFVETFAKAYISGRWADAIVFGILIVVLSVKPTGILGKNVREKV
ncbi:branched-chain amino acid ABC transporter permease [Alkalibacter saccharofermentans]|uniref:Amino acid/amide ABC transporter membrane protein 1, HAAT family (TC 3.A.1.4.-) n=1 Tax=Alkalibacter saccharofermentans DSM 14828 TaxID=1120975 RepID=A0A1M4YVK8_9FIRM|nr:branched-chain amino acid ABC transporter permease [Alkalibacter saccharofermentans]SHF09770.1 amino acid/amide ABC transporter membrane protein 1, HAAT family (TC 3.A.1.4.-) [Alkalibacter saccharofermentans DSM 14828]